jgi:hypothetical protein
MAREIAATPPTARNRAAYEFLCVSFMDEVLGTGGRSGI